ncbi:hypothetical protein CRG98_044669, partial [Punica granatum]
MAVTASSPSLRNLLLPPYRLAAPPRRRLVSVRAPGFSLSYGLAFTAARTRPIVRARAAASSLYAASLEAEEEEVQAEDELMEGEEDTEAVNIAEDVSQ